MDSFIKRRGWSKTIQHKHRALSFILKGISNFCFQSKAQGLIIFLFLGIIQGIYKRECFTNPKIIWYYFSTPPKGLTGDVSLVLKKSSPLFTTGLNFSIPSTPRKCSDWDSQSAFSFCHHHNPKRCYPWPWAALCTLNPYAITVKQPRFFWSVRRTRKERK